MSSNNVLTTPMHSLKHPNPDVINHDESSSARIVKKSRTEEIHVIDAAIPSYSIGNMYNDTLLHTRVMRMCQNDLIAMKAMSNQELCSPQESIFIQASTLSSKSPYDLQNNMIHHQDSNVRRHQNNSDGNFATWNLDMRSTQMIFNYNTSLPVMTSHQAIPAFVPVKPITFPCPSNNKNRCTPNEINQALSTALNHVRTFDYFPQNHHSNPTVSGVTIGTNESCQKKMPNKLPFCLAQPEDKYKLSDHQMFLRFQIEAFAATEDDVHTHIRGRNKRIVLGQVGIRCRHCAHLRASRRQKGAAYFPANTTGLYQAAQNMSTAHIQCGLCPEMPEYIKEHFKGLIATKSFTSGAGRPYWAKSAKDIGLVDTEDGIRFIHDLPKGTTILEDN